MTRKPWLAALLSFIMPGLGHIYAGQLRKGLIIAGLILLCYPLLYALLYIKLTVVFMFLYVGVALAVMLFIIVDAYRVADNYYFGDTLRSYNRWYIYLIIYCVFNFAINPLITKFVRENLVQAYKIPSGAMIPTMLVGDHVLTDKVIYRKKVVHRGDIVIFPYPKKPSQAFVKRVVGLAGDVVEIRDKGLYLNGEKQDEEYVVHLDPKSVPEGGPPRDNFGPVSVPEGHLFVMGDNRDNSHDSRFWGFVEQDNVKGKVVKLYWSWDKENMKVRWDRIGMLVE